MRRARSAGERGSVTAELAVVLPAVLVVLAGCLGCVHVIVRQSAVVSAAATSARSLARGEDESETRRVLHRLVPGAALHSERDGELVCARVGASARLFPAGVASIRVHASSCALAGGR